MPFRKSQYRLPREEGTSPHSQLSFSLSLTLYFCFLLVQFLCTCVPVQSCLTLCDPMDCSPPGSSVHGLFQARKKLSATFSGVVCHFLLRGIFLTQGWNPCLLHWQVDSLPLSNLGNQVFYLRKQNFHLLRTA